DLELPRREAPRRHPQVPEGDREARGLARQVLPATHEAGEGHRPALLRGRLRRRPVPARTARGCEARTRRSASARSALPRQDLPRLARGHSLRGRADARPEALGVHDAVTGDRTIESLLADARARFVRLTP